MRYYCAVHNREHCQLCPTQAKVELEARTVGNWDPNLVAGEVKAILREEHLCNSCLMSVVCKVANAVDDSMLAVVSRCAMHIDPDA